MQPCPSGADFPHFPPKLPTDPCTEPPTRCLEGEKFWTRGGIWSLHPGSALPHWRQVEKPPALCIRFGRLNLKGYCTREKKVSQPKKSDLWGLHPLLYWSNPVPSPPPRRNTVLGKRDWQPAFAICSGPSLRIHNKHM